MTDPMADPQTPDPQSPEPEAPDPQAADAESPDPSTPASRKSRRGLIALLIVLAVLVVGLILTFFAVDAYAKATARDYIRERIVAALGLPADAEVEVDLGGGLLLPQVLQGRVDQVDIDVPEATFGPLTGAATVHAEQVPLDETQPVPVLAVEFRVAEDDLPDLARNLAGLELDSIRLDPPEIVGETEFSVFGFAVPVGLALEPSAVDGEIVFTPTTVLFGGEEIDADALLADPVFGGLAQGLFQQQSVCVAEQLPAALTVTEVVVEDDALAVFITGDGARLGGEELATTGTCAAR